MIEKNYAHKCLCGLQKVERIQCMLLQFAIYFKIQTLWKYLIDKNCQIEVP